MSSWGPQEQSDQGAATGEIVVARQLTPAEGLKRLQVARNVMTRPILVPVLVGALLLSALVAGIMTSWSIGWILAVGLGMTLLVGGAVALGLMLGTDVLRRQAAFELGESGVLTVTWSQRGGDVTAENLRRSFSYREIQWVKEGIDGHVIVKLPMQWHSSQYVMALTPDLVPAQARQWMSAAGVPTR